MATNSDPKLYEAIKWLNNPADKHVESCSSCGLGSPTSFGYTTCLFLDEKIFKPQAFFERLPKCPFPSVGGDETWRGVAKVTLFAPGCSVLFRQNARQNYYGVITRKGKVVRGKP